MFRTATPTTRDFLPLLVTGVTGVAGQHALCYLQSQYPGRVFGMRQAADDRLTGPGILACDAEDRDGLARLFDRHGFAAVLDCAGNCALKACELDPAMAHRINVEGPENLARQSVRLGARLVHLSVDLVFSGLRDGDYREDDPVDPVTMYGKTMVRAEERILQVDPSACILRISLPMGVSLNGHAGAIDWITSRFKKGRPATLYVDEVRTPTYTDCLSRLCETMLAGDWAGVYHAAAGRRLSLYQIAQVINRIGGYAPELLRGIPRVEAGPIPPRAGNVSMNGAKLAAALGRLPSEAGPLDPWPLGDDCVPTDSDWHRRRPRDEVRSPGRLVDLLAVHPRRRGPHSFPGLDPDHAAQRYATTIAH